MGHPARKIQAADLYCGAGGTSTGLAMACKELDRAVELLAINHWARAIETHTKNHPWATHLCATLETIDPRKVVPGGYLDLLVASPECIFHSTARGGRPINDQARASAFRVLEWCDKLHISSILIENVPEFVNWSPVDKNGRPIKSKRGETFRHFIRMLESFNYTVDHRVLNSADYGGATTRKRLFIMARKGRRRISWPEPSHSKEGGADLFGQKPRWRAAREIIDWSLKGRSIFRRKRPLAKTTLERIYSGLVKFGGPAAEPLVWYLRRYIDHVYPPLIKIWEPTIYRAEVRVIGEAEAVPRVEIPPFVTVLERHRHGLSVDDPLSTITARGNKLFLTEPFVIGQQSNAAPRPVSMPLPTIATAGKISLVETSFMLQQQSGGVARTVGEPFPTIAARGAISLATFLVPFFGERRGQAPRHQSLDQPCPAVTSHGAGGLVESFILPNKGFYRGWENAPRSIDQPIGTVTSRGAGALIEAFMITPGGADLRGGRPVSMPVPTVMTYDRLALVRPFLVNMKGRSKASSIDKPCPTQTTQPHVYVTEPYLIQVAHGGGLDRRTHSVGVPLPTLLTSNRLGLVQPRERASEPEPRPYLVEITNGSWNGKGARDVEGPLPTVLAKSHLGMVEPYLIKVNHGKASGDRSSRIDSPLQTVTGKNGFGLVDPFLVKFYRDPHTQNQAVSVPLQTVTTKGRFGLVVTEPDLGDPPGDIFFRMMVPRELARAMGFEHYEFTGTQEEQVRQIGNAVSVEIAKALCKSLLET